MVDSKGITVAQYRYTLEKCSGGKGIYGEKGYNEGKKLFFKGGIAWSYQNT